MNHPNEDRPQFARSNGTATGPLVELRGECPKDIVDVLDAISFARAYPTRTALVNEILGDWAKKVRHENSVLNSVLGVIPALSDSGGRSAS